MLPVSPEARATVENHHLIDTAALLKKKNFKKGFFNLPYMSLITLLDDKKYMIKIFLKRSVNKSDIIIANYNEGCKLNTVIFFFCFLN